MRKILLLDIDNTTFHHQTPRPYLKEFILRMLEKYEVHFYTAADIWRVKEACRILEELGILHKMVREIYLFSLSYESCPMIQYKTPSGGYVDIKPLDIAAKKFHVPVENLILLDDMPMHDNPHKDQRIQAPGFWGQEDDVYLKTLEI